MLHYFDTTALSLSSKVFLGLRSFYGHKLATADRSTHLPVTLNGRFQLLIHHFYKLPQLFIDYF